MKYFGTPMDNKSIKWKAGLIIVSASFVSIFFMYLLNKSVLHDFIFESEKEILVNEAKKVDYFLTNHFNRLQNKTEIDLEKHYELNSKAEDAIISEMEELFNIVIVIKDKKDFHVTDDNNINQTSSGFTLINDLNDELFCYFELEENEYLKEKIIGVKLKYNLHNKERNTRCSKKNNRADATKRLWGRHRYIFC